MSKPKAPTPPDPKVTAAAQTDTNIATALANQAVNLTNQVTPYGTLTYTRDPTDSYTFTDPASGKTTELPRYTATTQLTPEQQTLLDQQQRGQTALAQLGADSAERLGGILGTGADFSSIPQPVDRWSAYASAPGRGDGGGYGADLATPAFSASLTAPQYRTGDVSAPDLTTSYVDDFSADRQRVEQALLERARPELDRYRTSEQTRLANQGIKLNSTAYNDAIDTVNRRENDAVLGAILAGGEEQSRLAGLSRDQALFGNTARQQDFTNQFGLMSYGNDILSRGFADEQAIQGRNDAVAQLGFTNEQSVQDRRDALTQQDFQNRQQVLGAQERARAQALSELYAARNQPINEIAALLGGAQVQQPSFVNTPQTNIATTDYAGLVGQNFNQQQQNYQQKMAQQNAILGGLFGLGGAAILA